MVTTTMEYKSAKKMKKGIAQMSVKGWRVDSTQFVEKSRSCLGILLFGIFAFMGKKPGYYQVVFSKEGFLTTS